MRVIFVNRFFFPDHSATSQMLSGVAFGLAKCGHRVTIITSRQRYDMPDAALPAREFVDGVEVIRIATTRFGRNRLLGRAFDYITFYVSAMLAVLRQARRGDVVVAKTDPPMLSVVLWPVTALRRGKLVNWLQDIFPEVASSALGVGSNGASRIAFATLAWLRNHSLRGATVNVVLGERMANHLARLGVDPERTMIVPNWADGTMIRPIAPQNNELRKTWGLDGAFVIGYSGNLGRAHDISTMLAAIEAVETAKTRVAEHGSPGAEPCTNRPFRWLFIGGGAQLHALKSAVEERRLTSVVFQPYQPQKILAQSLSVPDVHLISLKPELEGLIVPSKLYGIMAAGRPSIFIGNPDGEVAQLVVQNDIGRVVSEGDSDALAAAVVDLSSDEQSAIRAGDRARTLFEGAFDLPQAIGMWEKVLVKAAEQRQ